MLDFFLVLGQVPGTQFFLTFNQIITGYAFILTIYVIRREILSVSYFSKRMFLNYFMYVTRPHRGRPIRKTVLWLDHINLIPLEDIGVRRLHLRLARLFLQSI
jgi:hypothetical protein